jgi:hypothetical protein
VTPLLTGAEAFMRENEVFTMAASGDYLAIGTVRRGLILVNRHTKAVKYFNERNGLQNNTVLSISFDKRNNLWLGLDNGIDYISLNTPFTNLYTYPYSSGAGYASVVYQGKLYLGTNSGVYHTSWPVKFGETSADIEFMPRLSGQVWDMRVVDGKLFCMHDKGLFVLDGDKIEQVEGLRGVWTCVPHAIDSDKLWAGTYEGLFLLERKEGKWRVEKRVEGISDWFKNFEFESPDVLWIRNTSHGALRVQLDTTSYKVKQSRFYSVQDGFKSVRNLFITKVDGKVYFSSDSGLYEYNPAKDRMEPSKTISTNFPHSVLKRVGKDMFGLDRDGLGVLKKNDTGDKMFSVIYPINHKQIDFIRYYENFEVIGDSTVIIPNEHGFSLLNLNFRKFKETGKELFIRNVFSTYPKDSLLYTANYTGNSYCPRNCLFPKLPSVRVHHACIRSGEGGTLPFHAESRHRMVRIYHLRGERIQWTERGKLYLQGRGADERRQGFVGYFFFCNSASLVPFHVGLLCIFSAVDGILIFSVSMGRMAHQT